ncbi:PREDICTED: uncharacterized protein LOC105588555 [Cercocebus atys]|uniref:uncharacterized protein LOC105588555 n=1 Tax=Cercocebus atys TaxID=9531 RepID=UPI0005F53FE7|nr:PREDICTED: uncharacterized protein LOC105588555 [Cercocebus atys]
MPECTAADRLGTYSLDGRGWAVGLAAGKMLRDVPMVRQLGPCSRQNLIGMFLQLGLGPTRCGWDVPRPCGQVVGMFLGHVVRWSGRSRAVWSGGQDVPGRVVRMFPCHVIRWSGCSRPCGQVFGMFLGRVVRMFPCHVIRWSGCSWPCGQDVPGRVVRMFPAVWSGVRDVPGPCGQDVPMPCDQVVRMFLAVWSGCSRPCGQDVPGRVVRWSGCSRPCGQDVGQDLGQAEALWNVSLQPGSGKWQGAYKMVQFGLTPGSQRLQ